MFEVVVQNFQIIEDLNLVVDGLTIVTGATNNGKSSLVRAVDAVMFNKSGQDFINDRTTDDCVVGLKFPDLQLVWVKPQTGGATYYLNGEEFTKFGRGVPAEVVAAGFREIEVKHKKYKLNIWKQMEEPFLVSQPSTAVFDFISAILEERKLVPVLKNMKDNLGKKKDAIVAIKGQVEFVRESYDRTVEVLASLQSGFDSIQQIKPVVLEVSGKLLVLEGKRSELQSLSPVKIKLQYKKVQTALESAKGLGIEAEWKRLRSLLDFQAQVKQVRKSEGIVAKAVEEQEETRKLVETIDALNTHRLFTLMHWRDMLHKIGGELAEVEEEQASLATDLEAHLKEFEDFKEGELNGVCPLCRSTEGNL